MKPEFVAHKGDPCQYCGIAHDEIQKGQCIMHQRMKIDRVRCSKAMNDITVSGRPRPHIIAKAIANIHADGEAAMKEEFLGVKNYAGFGDQDCDCGYGMGPRHGSIVFSIGRTRGTDGRRSATVLRDDHVYLLECVRDFGVIEHDSPYERGKKSQWNLCDVIRRGDTIALELEMLTEKIDAVDVDFHTPSEPTP